MVLVIILVVILRIPLFQGPILFELNDPNHFSDHEAASSDGLAEFGLASWSLEVR